MCVIWCNLSVKSGMENLRWTADADILLAARVDGVLIAKLNSGFKKKREKKHNIYTVNISSKYYTVNHPTDRQHYSHNLYIHFKLCSKQLRHMNTNQILMKNWWDTSALCLEKKKTQIQRFELFKQIATWRHKTIWIPLV